LHRALYVAIFKQPSSEGQTFLATASISADDEGLVLYTLSTPVSNTFVSATVTNELGDTSEFSMVDTDADGLGDACDPCTSPAAILKESTPSISLMGVANSPEDLARTEKQWADSGQGIVDAVQQAATAGGVNGKAVVMRSDLVAESVMAAAKKYKCGLIVMASHGRKGFKRVLLGSETTNVLTHSTIPVLIVR